MNLLIVTQKVNKDDDNLGFFHRWIIEFARHFEQVTVICLEEGVRQLPANVRVLSLGKEKGGSRILYAGRFLRYVWRERHTYDAVLVHMNPEYIVLGGWLWKMLGKNIFLWYTHKSVTRQLKWALRLVAAVFSASPESFRLPTSKLIVTGHGIDTDVFSPPAAGVRLPGSLISVGRISPTKDQLSMIKAVELLADEGWSGRFRIIGTAVTPAERTYAQSLSAYVEANGLGEEVIFVGTIPHEEVAVCYQSADIFINLSTTGSLDKAVLEAMACGTKVLTSNEAFRRIVPQKNLTTGVPADIAQKARALLNEPAADPMLHDYVVRHHSLVPTIARISAEIISVL